MRQQYALSGREFFQHRLSGVLEPRTRFTLSGRQSFSLRFSGELRSAERGDSPRPRRRAKRKGHLRFPFLFELLPFPCFLIWRKPETGDRFEKGYGRGFFLPCFSQPVRSTRYITATQTGKSTQARHARVAQLVSLEITDSTYEDKLYLIDRFAGAFRHNAQKIWSALLCRPLRRVTNMCSSNLSDAANMSGHGSTLCSPTEEKILCRSPIFAAVTCRQSTPG